MLCGAVAAELISRRRACLAAARLPKTLRPSAAPVPRKHVGQGALMSNRSTTLASAPPAKAGKPAIAARTRVLLEAPIISTLLRLAAPNVVVNVVLIAITATVDAHFIGRLGSHALAGISLVFPFIMLMQQMANSSMGGAI